MGPQPPDAQPPDAQSPDAQSPDAQSTAVPPPAAVLPSASAVVSPPAAVSRPVDDAPHRVLDPLWRGLVGYRLLALGYAAVLVALNQHDYRRPWLADAVLALVAGWTALSTLGYLSPRRWLTRGRTAALDLVITLGGVLATAVVETPERIHAGEPILTSVWSAGPAIALALECGVPAGLFGALLVQGAVLVVRGRVGTAELTDLLLIVAATAAVGYAAGMLTELTERLRRAVALRAALDERERLARSIHDGVLQVLAGVRRRGAELGGPAAQLGELAGEQEIALRTLVTTGPPLEQPAGQLDVATRLAQLSGARVSVAVPPHAVPLDARVATEVVAAAGAVLDNVRAHAGAGARAWVLVEDLGDTVLVSLRDDGPGIAEGRLAEAAAQGRLGVRQSIVGRIESVGGAARCVSEPELGCEWTFELPKRGVEG